jgi:pyruvate dehydrogenase E1 component beta subunit
VARTGALLTLEEGQVTCGVGAEVCAQVQGVLGPLPVHRVGALAAPVSSNPVLEAACIPDAKRVAAETQDFVRRNKR